MGEAGDTARLAEGSAKAGGRPSTLQDGSLGNDWDARQSAFRFPGFSCKLFRFVISNPPQAHAT
jgi:hypothetical protein